jgi:hypothetical protein
MTKKEMLITYSRLIHQLGAFRHNKVIFSRAGWTGRLSCKEKSNKKRVKKKKRTALAANAQDEEQDFIQPMFTLVTF